MKYVLKSYKCLNLMIQLLYERRQISAILLFTPYNRKMFINSITYFINRG